MRNGMRAYVSDTPRNRKGGTVGNPLVIKVGPLTTQGSLYPMLSPVQDGKYKLCTPDAKPVHLVYRDDDGNIYESKDELERAKIVDGEYEIVDKDNISKAREAALDKNVVICSVHRPEDVKDISWPTKKASYVFYPTENNDINVISARLIVPITEKYAVMTQANIQGHEGVYRIQTYKNRLVLVPQVYSDQFNPHDEDPAVMPQEDVETALRLAENLVEPLNEEEYRNLALDRLRAAEVAAIGKLDVQTLLENQRKKVDFSSVLADAMAAIGKS